MAKKIGKFKIVQSDYFPGDIVGYPNCATGIGLTEKAALENALLNLAEDGWDAETLADRAAFKAVANRLDDKTARVGEAQEYFVSVYVKAA